MQPEDDTITVMDARLRLSQMLRVLSHDEIREELIRQLESGTVRAANVARALKVTPGRVSEMKKRERRVQPQEMATLAHFLGMTEGEAPSLPSPPLPPPWSPNEATLARLLEAVLPYVLAARDPQVAVREVAPEFAGVLKWFAEQPEREADEKAVAGRLHELIGRIGLGRLGIHTEELDTQKGNSRNS